MKLFSFWKSWLGPWLLLSTALAARFAAFSVEPFGPQRVNLDTGVTTLPQGGVLTDNETGLRLKGQFMEYREGDFIYLRKGEMVSEAYAITATELTLNIPRQMAIIDGLSLNHALFSELQIKKAYFFLAENILVGTENVRGRKPVLEAQKIIIDVKAKNALVIGDFVFRQQGSALQGKGAQSRLFLSMAGNTLRGTTRIPPEAAALETWLKRVP